MGLDKVSETICWALEETRENSRLASQNTKPSWMVISPHVAVTCRITCQAHKEKMWDGGGREAWEVQHQGDKAWNWNFIPIHSQNTDFSTLNSRLLYSWRLPERKARLLSAALFCDNTASCTISTLKNEPLFSNGTWRTRDSHSMPPLFTRITVIYKSRIKLHGDRPLVFFFLVLQHNFHSLFSVLVISFR